ncbi:hypothetical protein M011DRAFT_482766 [Sporormia fimetaria CBS 119925]|uniref:Tim44-like domain-containing protein n=1 Tax=Sporormia fimetaria CBS 119925 TaxID=1340428 RepID=A0A6A6VN16_9PLEO|nr:hypothetical protein M011DRAFT_482766 [Sporormia fimetaria CBS 119925]
MSQQLPLALLLRPIVRRPLARPTVFRAQCLRQFSTTPALGKPKRPKPEEVKQPTDSDQLYGIENHLPAPSTQMVLHQNDAEFLEKGEYGLMSGTFIRAWDTTPALIPTSNLTSLAAWKETLAKRWTYEKAYLKERASTLYSLIAFKWFLVHPRPSHVFNLAPIKHEALRKYPRLAIAFYQEADRNLADPKHWCTDGFIENMEARLRDRDENLKFKWSPVGKLSARVVSNKFALIQRSEDKKDTTYQRQVVVKITGRQKLKITYEPKDDIKKTKAKFAWVPEGTDAGETGMKHKHNTEPQEIVKRVVEYMVWEMRCIKGAPKDWKMWGFTHKTTLESIAEARDMEERFKRLQQMRQGYA